MVSWAVADRGVLGYEPPAILLLHLNRLNAATLDRLLRLLRQQGYRFVSLDESEEDTWRIVWSRQGDGCVRNG